MAQRSIGETPARRALRENTVTVTGALQRHLSVIRSHLIEKHFMTDAQFEEIVSPSGISIAQKSNGIMGAIAAKVNSGNNPERGRRWLKEFLVILTQQDIGEYELAQDMAKVYCESKYLYRYLVVSVTFSLQYKMLIVVLKITPSLNK